MWLASILPVLALGAAGVPASESAGLLASAAAPPPIFWRQTLFSIPFQVQRTANPAQEPVEVQLFVSPDRGVHWDNRPWMKAQPQKGYFLFRAGVDGEYWFDVRTLDRSGQVRPQGPHSPKLVVVVDTAPPKVQLTAHRGDDGRIAASFHIEEPYLKMDSLLLDYRLTPNAAWQGVLVAPHDIHTNDSVHTGEVSWYPNTQNAAGTIDVRLRVSDLAGNSAESHAQVNMSPTAASDLRANVAAPADTTLRVPAAASQPPAMTIPSGQTPWPAENVSAAAGGPALSAIRNGNADAGVAIRVNPPASNQLIAVRDPAATAAASANPTPPPAFSDFRPSGSNLPGTQPNLPSPSGRGAGGEGRDPNLSSAISGFSTSAAMGCPDIGPPPGVQLRWINSRVFQLTYDTRALGGNGNAAVELWGTRDGGKTWQSFGSDAKGQSPMLVTVPEEGIYGFRMNLLVNGAAGRPPLSGEVPRTWIGVDLTRPAGRITQARQGAGRDADKLFITWEAADNRALAEKPIAAFLQRTRRRPLDSDRRRAAELRAVRLAVEGQSSAAGLPAAGGPRRGGQPRDV